MQWSDLLLLSYSVMLFPLHTWSNLLCSLLLLWQRLCDYVCDLLLEESNVQPVSTPVTVCGDIHGQVRAGLMKASLLCTDVVTVFFYITTCILIETFSFSSFMTYVNSSELGAKYQTQITFSWYCIHKDNYT